MNDNADTKQFRTVAELAAFLDSLHEMTDDGGVMAHKWEPAQRALAALEAGRSGEAAGEVVESDNADGSTVLRVCWFGGIPPSGTKLYDHPQQPPPVGVTSKVTLTAAEITDLAEFAGLRVSRPDDIEPDTEIDVYPCPPEGVHNEGEPSDPDSVSHYRYIAVCGEYPEEGCMGLGPELAKASA